MSTFTQNQKDCCTNNGFEVVSLVDSDSGFVYGNDCVSPNYQILGVEWDGSYIYGDDDIVIDPYNGLPEGSDGDPCIYFASEEDTAGNPFNWDGFNSLLSTLGGIAVPFLPFLFGDETPSGTGNNQATRQEYEAQQGQKLIVGFVILIALSVGVFLYMKRKK